MIMIDDLLRNDLSFPLLGQRIIAETLNSEVCHFGSILSIVNCQCHHHWKVSKSWTRKEHGDGDRLDNEDDDGDDEEDGGDDDVGGDDGDGEDDQVPGRGACESIILRFNFTSRSLGEVHHWLQQLL